MAAQRKRKHVSTEDRVQRGIEAFASIGKAHTSDNDLKKRKTIHRRDASPPPEVQRDVMSKNKRKRSDEETQDLAEDDAKMAAACRNTATPRSKRVKHILPQSPVGTPSKSAADLFRDMKLGKATAAIPFSLNARQIAYDTPPDTPEASPRNPDLLPAELDHLLPLQAAFLSSLSLYYAHNGTSSSVSVKELLPMVTKAWRKRAVVLDDLRMLLAVYIYNDSGFELRDFGRGGICLVKVQPRGRPSKRFASYIDEADFNSRFENALQKRWADWRAVTLTENFAPEAFLDQLPLVEIANDTSVANAAPLFVRGKQRLSEIKASQAAMEQQSRKATAPTPALKTNAAVENRGASLLDRILTKQANSVSLPAGPTRDQLEKKAALQRIEETARVLDLLSAGRPRCSFSMQAMIQQLQQSLRNPISREQAEKCLDLMATDITPGFVSMIRSGSVTGVVVTKSGKVETGELKRRVQAACEAMG